MRALASPLAILLLLACFAAIQCAADPPHPAVPFDQARWLVAATNVRVRANAAPTPAAGGTAKSSSSNKPSLSGSALITTFLDPAKTPSKVHLFDVSAEVGTLKSGGKVFGDVFARLQLPACMVDLKPKDSVSCMFYFDDAATQKAHALAKKGALVAVRIRAVAGDWTPTQVKASDAVRLSF